MKSARAGMITSRMAVLAMRQPTPTGNWILLGSFPGSGNNFCGMK